jgi:hypothetical protein
MKINHRKKTVKSLLIRSVSIFPARAVFLFLLIGLCIPIKGFGISIEPITRSHAANDPVDWSGSISVLPGADESSWVAKIIPVNLAADVSWLSVISVPPSFAAYSMNENFNAEDRKALIDFGNNVVFTCIQRGRGATVVPEQITVNKYGSTNTLTVSVLPGTFWKFDNTNSWIFSPGSTVYFGSGARMIQVEANTNLAPRTASILVGGKTVFVSQDGVDLFLSTNSVTVSFGLSIINIGVNALAATSWRPTVDKDWLKLVDPNNQNGSGQISVIVSPNDSFLERNGTIVVGSKIVNITQIGNKLPIFQIDPAQTVASPSGASGNIGVQATTGLPWRAKSAAPWVRVKEPGLGVGNGKIEMTALPNTGMSPRVGHVVFERDSIELSENLPGSFAFAQYPKVLMHLNNKKYTGIDQITKQKDWRKIVAVLNSYDEYVDRGSSGGIGWRGAYDSAASITDNRVSWLSQGGEGWGWSCQSPPRVFDIRNYGWRQDSAWYNGQIGFENDRVATYGIEFGDLDFVQYDGGSLEGGAGWPLFRVLLSANQNQVAGNPKFYYQQGCQGRRPATMNNKLNGFIQTVWELEDMNLRMTALPPNNEQQGFTVFSVNEGGTPIKLGLESVLATIDPNSVPNLEPGSPGFLVCAMAISHSGVVTIYANGSEVLRGTVMQPLEGKRIRATFKHGSRLVVYGSELSPDAIANAGMQLCPTRTLTIRQEGVVVEVAPLVINTSANGGNGTITVTAPNSTSWSAGSSAAWIKIDGADSISRTGPHSVVVSTQPNESTTSRRGTITVAGQQVTVSQDARIVTLQPLSIGMRQVGSLVSGNINSIGGILALGINPENGAAWKIEPRDVKGFEWIKPSPSFGLGQQKVNFAIAPFSESQSSRHAVFDVGDKTILITQSGFSAVLDPSLQKMDGSGGVYAAKVSVPVGSFWEAISLTQWIKIVTKQEVGGGGYIYYSVSENGDQDRFGFILLAGDILQVVQSQRRGDIGYNLIISRAQEGQIGLSVKGSEGHVFLLQKSDDLINWVNVSEIVAVENLGVDNIQTLKLNIDESRVFFRCIKIEQ